ncbi:MAG: TetR/AcrR family transcriptional regulator [Actinobacteria bacterium]|nr:TetR/AcrR family transcriptional regulator [Actinomycetota bacterium]
MSSDESETRTRILEAMWRLMVQRRGQGVRMRDVAEAAGVSRQAVYLHFGSRAELMVATARYGDEVRGLDERLRRYRAATAGVERLEAFVEFWGNYIPEIYGIARALLAARETDEAVAAAWDDRMGVVREGCRNIIEALHRDGTLVPGWPRDEAVDLLWTMLSIRNWESLTIESGWSTSQYVVRMQELSKRAFVRGAEGT